MILLNCEPRKKNYRVTSYQTSSSIEDKKECWNLFIQ